MFKKIISFILIIAIVVSLCCVPTLALDFDDLSIWQYFFGASDPVTAIDYLSHILPRNNPGCFNSSDGYHHWSVPVPIVAGAVAFFDFDVHCTECLITLSEYLTGEEGNVTADLMPSVYDNYTQSLPAQTITNTGSFYVKGVHDRLSSYSFSCIHGFSGSNGPFSPANYVYGTIVFSHSGDNVSVTMYPQNGKSSFSVIDNYTSYWTVPVPVSGTYTRLETPSVLHDGVVYKNWGAQSAFRSSSWQAWFEAGSLSGTWTESSLTFLPPVYLCAPATALNVSTGDTYNIDNRVSNYVTQYLVDNSVNTTQIINETNNTYYSPITNETYDMSGWTYDYSTRTYNITIDGSDGATVTFGDNAIQIVEGNVTNNYYYYITPSDDPDDPGGDTSGLLAWLQEVWPNLMAKLDEIKDAIGGDGSGSVSDHWWQDNDNPDDPDADDDLGILELFKTVLRGLINILNGFLSLIFDGIENLIEWIGSIGDFFDYFSPNSDVNIWTVEEGSA